MKYSLLLFLALTGLFITGCGDEDNNPVGGGDITPCDYFPYNVGSKVTMRTTNFDINTGDQTTVETNETEITGSTNRFGLTWLTGTGTLFSTLSDDMEQDIDGLMTCQNNQIELFTEGFTLTRSELGTDTRTVTSDVRLLIMPLDATVGQNWEAGVITIVITATSEVITSESNVTNTYTSTLRALNTTQVVNNTTYDDVAEIEETIDTRTVQSITSMGETQDITTELQSKHIRYISKTFGTIKEEVFSGIPFTNDLTLIIRNEALSISL